VIERSRRFVCAADEVWRLQRGSEADCVFFQRTINAGERITDRGSRQGVWVLAPGGVVLAHVNSRDVERVLTCLEQGLAAWETLPEERRHLPADVELTPAHRWESNCPTDGLVLERISRELDPEGLAAAPRERWNRDLVWLSAEEVAGLVPAEVAVGDSFALPLLAQRLARFHLVDDPRGQTLPYAPSEVARARLIARVTARTEVGLELVLRGATRAATDGSWRLGDNLWRPAHGIAHGMECTLLGRATFDPVARRFETFELAAVGRRWGRTENNGRGADIAPSLVAFHLQLAPTELRLPPTFVAIYDADWIRPPAVPTWLDSPAECGLDAR